MSSFMLRTRYKEWQEQGIPMVPLHFTGTRAGTTWVATGSQLNMLPAFAEGLEARTSLPALPLPSRLQDCSNPAHKTSHWSEPKLLF